MSTENLGLVKLVFVGASPPINTQMIWYDTNVNLHKYYNTLTSIWTLLISSNVVFYANFGSLPSPGQAGLLYVTMDEQMSWFWDTGTNAYDNVSVPNGVDKAWGFNGVSPTTSQGGYTITGGDVQRLLNADTVDLGDLVDFVATLANDLKAKGIIKT